MKAARFLFLTVTAVSAHGAAAFDLQLPEGSRLTHERVTDWGVTELPLSSWTGEEVATLRLEGGSTARAWQVLGLAQSTAQTMGPLRDQVEGAGYEILFECAARECGGFDFRYAVDVVPEPDMHVDLGDFRVLTARASDAPGAEHVSILVSRSSERGFVQMIEVDPSDTGTAQRSEAQSGNGVSRPRPNPANQPASAPTPVVVAGEFASKLLAEGHTPLPDLSFQTGSSQLADQPFASLAEIAAFLKARPDAVIMLVGHTDTDGALSANINLSKKRAGAVLNRLAEAHGVARSRMRAEGVGYLAPIASNISEAGRKLNRRVEVILTNPE